MHTVKLKEKVYFSSFRFLLNFDFGPRLRKFCKPKVRLRRGRKRKNADSTSVSKIRVIFRGEPLTNAFRRGGDAGGRGFLWHRLQSVMRVEETQTKVYATENLAQVKVLR